MSLDELHKIEWLCTGPDRVGGFASTKPAKGKKVNYWRCMGLPDCSCWAFRCVAQLIEEKEEEEWT